MKKISKKIMAFAMAAAVMMSSSVTVSASQVAQGYATGSGGIIDTVNKNVFDVILPTNTEGTFNFTLDPQKLLYAYDSETYNDPDTTLYFNTNTNKSEELTITNKSSMDVNVTIEAKMTNTDMITMVDDPAAFEGDDTTSLYLGLILAGGEPVALEQAGTVEATTTLSAVPESEWEMKGNPLNGDATWELKDDADQEKFDTTEFQMTGACNSNADWSEISKQKKAFNPTFDVIWTIEATTEEPADQAPSGPATHTHNVGTLSTITVNLGKGELAATSIKSVKYATAATGSWTDSAANLTASGNTITITAALWGSLSGQKNQKRYIQVIFDDAASTTIVIEVTVNPE